MKKLFVLLFVALTSLMMACNPTVANQPNTMTRSPTVFTHEIYALPNQAFYSLEDANPKRPRPPSPLPIEFLLTLNASPDVIKGLWLNKNTTLPAGSFKGTEANLNVGLTLNLKGIKQDILDRLNGGTVDVSQAMLGKTPEQALVTLTTH